MYKDSYNYLRNLLLTWGNSNEYRNHNTRWYTALATQFLEECAAKGNTCHQKEWWTMKANSTTLMFRRSNKACNGLIPHLERRWPEPRADFLPSCFRCLKNRNMHFAACAWWIQTPSIIISETVSPILLQSRLHILTLSPAHIHEGSYDTLAL